LDLTSLADPNDQEFGDRSKLSWVRVKTNGLPNVVPGNLAYHSTIVHKEFAYIFGGNNYEK
jgi:hypothetical protein